MKRFLFLILAALLLVGPVVTPALAIFVNSDIQSPTVTRRVGDLAALKLITGKSTILSVQLMGRVNEGDGGEGVFRWLSGDQSANPDVLSDATNEGVFVKPTTPGDGSTGVWVRQYLGNLTSVLWFGATGNGITDDTVAIQSAIDFMRAIYLPIGTYLVSDTLRESTNGGALRIVGEHRKFSIIKSPGLAVPTLWLGNSNGHGNYRADLSEFTIDCVDQTAGSVALILHEAGTSHVYDIDLKNAEILCKAVGMIGSTIDGKCEWTGGVLGGLVFSAPVAGVPSGLDDLTTTASSLTLHTNINVVRDVWFSAIDADAVVLAGGLTTVTGCTFQSCGNDINSDVMRIENANESNDFGGGPIISDNWFEGGTYRYAISIRSTRAARLLNNFISGSSTSSPSNLPKEGGILKDSASLNTTIKGNSIRGFFVGTPTEGRIANGGVYTDGTLRREDVFDNYLVTSQVLNYYEGMTDPTVSRGHNDFEITVDDLSTVPVVLYDSHGIVSSVSRTSIGDYTITYNFNREIIGQWPISAFVRTSSSVIAYTASVFFNGAVNSDRIIVWSGAALADPFALTVRFKSGWQGI